MNVAGVKKGTASVTLVPVHILKDRLHDLNHYDKIILRAWLMVSEKVR
jgi:hypothetical protein